MASRLSQQAHGTPAAVSSSVIHNLYVFAADGGKLLDPDSRKSKKLTLAILKFIRDRLSLLLEMGVQVQAYPVKKKNLDNPRFIKAMKRRGISSLPALITPDSTYEGNRSIEKAYETGIAEYQTLLRRNAATALDADDDLANFYQSEMSFEQAADDFEVKSGDMMAAFNQMRQRREAHASKRTEASNPTIARRADNVAPQGKSGSAIDPLRSWKSGDRKEVELGSDFDDDENNPQDNLMEKAYWANMEQTL
ncbi:hypothetical protein ElyMa_002557700 [Elysia marginata]|uniref:Uncharacterized protein n=1 Tax=Elysia marginata TaxID=1093978 RepID=A0AAV4GX84_9GAST|nr:hypothetical protein ElyMa_002557700 [Elysia marginata]